MYLITDSSNGKKYVGSATGENMIWGRWKDYIANGNGGNIELKSFDLNISRRISDIASWKYIKVQQMMMRY